MGPDQGQGEECTNGRQPAACKPSLSSRGRRVGAALCLLTVNPCSSCAVTDCGSDPTDTRGLRLWGLIWGFLTVWNNNSSLMFFVFRQSYDVLTGMMSYIRHAVGPVLLLILWLDLSCCYWGYAETSRSLQLKTIIHSMMVLDEVQNYCRRSSFVRKGTRPICCSARILFVELFGQHKLKTE